MQMQMHLQRSELGQVGFGCLLRNFSVIYVRIHNCTRDCLQLQAPATCGDRSCQLSAVSPTGPVGP